MPLEWKLIKEFTDSKTGFTIRVTRASPGRPLYSLELGRENPMADRDGLVRHVPMRYEVTNGVVTYVSLRDVVSALLEQAEDFAALAAVTNAKDRADFNTATAQIGSAVGGKVASQVIDGENPMNHASV